LKDAFGKNICIAPKRQSFFQNTQILYVKILFNVAARQLKLPISRACRRFFNLQAAYRAP